MLVVGLAAGGGCEHGADHAAPGRGTTDATAVSAARSGAGASSTATPTSPEAAIAASSAASAPPAIASGSPAPTSSAPPANGCPEGMVRIAGGKLATLERGADVVVQDFCLDEVEVTVARFRAAVEAHAVTRGHCADGRCAAVPDYTVWFGKTDAPGQSDEDGRASRFCNGTRHDVDDHPVNCVTFEEARDTCAARGARLPTGDEWEWAAHGTRVTPWGTYIAKDEPCWGRPDKRNGTCAVRSHDKDRTEAGAWDLGGNVSEWVTPPARARKSPSRWAYGASWYAIDDGYARAALGGMEMPALRAETVGFRCASDAR
jgi:hypothetical protein